MSFLAVFFYQTGLYSSVILQIVLCCFCAWGYFNWTKASSRSETVPRSKKITVLTRRQRFLLVLIITLFVCFWGALMVSEKPDFLKLIFPKDYGHKIFGYFDAFVLIASMSGMFLRAQKKLENWIVFLLSDAMGVILYSATGAYFVTLMCSIYFLLDIKAIVSWRKELNS